MRLYHRIGIIMAVMFINSLIMPLLDYGEIKLEVNGLSDKELEELKQHIDKLFKLCHLVAEKFGIAMNDEEVRKIVDYLDQFTENMRDAVFKKDNATIKIILDEYVTLPNQRRLIGVGLSLRFHDLYSTSRPHSPCPAPHAVYGSGS